MNESVRPKIFLSACIEFDSCRYDGEMIRDDYVRRLLDFVDVVKVCPELAIGLGAPRDSIRLVHRKGEDLKLLSSSRGIDYTEPMYQFAHIYAEKLRKHDVDGFILKAKSPTCGIHNVKAYYDIGKANVRDVKNDGLFASVMNETFPAIPKETERRLSNYQIRDHFFTRIFTLASFKHLERKMKNLVDFHSRNKYLFMGYNQKTLKEMGSIVANHEKLPVETVFKNYQQFLETLLEGNTSMKKRVNVMTHIYGYFKKLLSPSEKEYYFEVLDQYMNNHVPYSNVFAVLKGWVIRFNDPYLKTQTVFEPYPKELIMVTDSGKTI